MADKHSILQNVEVNAPSVDPRQQILTYLPVATAGRVGVVKPDTSDLTVDENGVLHIINPEKEVYQLTDDESTELSVIQKFVDSQRAIRKNDYLVYSPIVTSADPSGIYFTKVYRIDSLTDTSFTKQLLFAFVSDIRTVHENVGQIEQVDFDATLEQPADGEPYIDCRLVPDLSDFTFKENSRYIIKVHLRLATLTGELDNDYPFYFHDKDGHNIYLNSIFAPALMQTSTVGDLRQLQQYTAMLGYTWTFTALYRDVDNNGNSVKVFYTDTIIRETNASMAVKDFKDALEAGKLANGTVVIVTNTAEGYTQGHSYKVNARITPVSQTFTTDDITPTSLPADGGNADTVDGKHASDFATAAQGAKADTAYQKPAEGIPATDLSANVQSSLEKADTAIQSLSGYATETYVDAKVAGLVNSAPETLDTLNELATALGNDPNFATTVATEIGKKVDKVDGKGLSQNDYTDEEKLKLAGIENGANNYLLPVAGSELGGVKSGGDITVSNDGTVSVKENKKLIRSIDADVYTTPKAVFDYIQSIYKYNGVNEPESNIFSLNNGVFGGLIIYAPTYEGLYYIGDGDGSFYIGLLASTDTRSIYTAVEALTPFENIATLDNLQGLATEAYVNSKIPTSLPANGGNADTVDGKHATDFATSAQGSKADTAYQKPTAGIPKTDLSASVQSSLEKADTAIQSLNGYATETYVNTKVAGIVNSAPEALDTLNELAKALGNDPNFATTVATEIGKKVDKVDGKGLSTNDYTNDDKDKLAGIEKNANNYVLPVAGSGTIGGVMVSTDSSISLTGTGAIYVKDNSHNHTIANVTNLQTTLNSKVDKVEGKGLSTNDFTDAEQLKLAGIEKNANKYVLTVAGSSLGGVKSGGDITVSGDGTVSVNDNSHNHTTSNITDLQTKLDAYAKLNDSQQSISAYSITVERTLQTTDIVADAYFIGDSSTSLIVGTTGTSTIQVMSQKSVTDALASKADKTQLQGLATEAYVDGEIASAIGNINSVLDTINGEVI